MGPTGVSHSASRLAPRCLCKEHAPGLLRPLERSSFVPGLTTSLPLGLDSSNKLLKEVSVPVLLRSTRSWPVCNWLSFGREPRESRTRAVRATDFHHAEVGVVQTVMVTYLGEV